MTNTIESWLRGAHGRCLKQVQGEVYVGCQAAADDSPISIWVQFAGIARVRIFCKPDGWGIGLDGMPSIGSGMGPAGRTVIRDMGKMSPFSRCMESALQGAALLESKDFPEPVGVRFSVLESPYDALANPKLLAGKNPAQVERLLKDTPGWRVEALGPGSHKGQGWVLRKYTKNGNPTGSMLRWHPGRGHHGPEPDWKVTSSRWRKSGEIR